MIFKELNKIDYKSLHYLEKIDKESMGDSCADIYTIRSILEIGKIIVAIIDEKIVGVSQIIRGMEDCSSSQLFGIYVIKEYQKRGIGDKLLKYTLNYLKNRGINSCELTVSPENSSAINLYKNNGFKIVKKSKNHYGREKDRLIMKWISKNNL